MRYAHVVLGLPVDKPFDYSIPEELVSAARPGCRVKVNFRGGKKTGYIVGVADISEFPSVKPLLSVIDEQPVLSAALLSLTQALSRYYCCSWGEMIETALPQPLRQGRKLKPGLRAGGHPAFPLGPAEPVTLLRIENPVERWQSYCELIKRTIAGGRSVIVLVADTGAIAQTRALISRAVTGASVGILYRNQRAESAEWQKIFDGSYNVVIGNRSAVFAPLAAPGLIIVDDEQDYGYKQDQVPHYHARIAAWERARMEKSGLVFGSAAPSLELMRMAAQGSAVIHAQPSEKYPAVHTIDTTRLPYGVTSRVFFSPYLRDAILKTTAAAGKVLVFLNRRGYATSAACTTCARVLKCPRCATNLVYYSRGQLLACSYCSFRMAPPKLCPSCNSGYIKFTGAGTEKIESELARLFPSARIASVSREEPVDKNAADIFVSTQSILSHPGISFELTAVLYLDNSLNHPDFRATEKAFGLLTGLAALTTQQLVIQTTVPGHYAVAAVQKHDPGIFYSQEMTLREQLKFPPFGHFAHIKVRGGDEEKVRAAAAALLAAVSGAARPKIAVVSSNPAQPPRIRDSYHWVILVSGDDPVKLSESIKICLNDFRRSGIIVTVDVDPV